MKPSPKIFLCLSLSLAAMNPCAASVTENAPFSEKAVFGGKEAHGGIAYVCRDASGKITFARLLDLWEGEDLKTWSSADPVETQLNAALEKIYAVSPNLWATASNNLAQIRSNTYYTDHLLNETTDAVPPYQADPGCAYEQVARYENAMLETGKSGLKINRKIYEDEAFSNSDRAALLLHEALYLRDRTRNQAEDSQRTRIAVANLFSESKIPNAVRMAFGAFSGIEIPIQPGNSDSVVVKKRNLIFALKEPKQMNLKITFLSIDGRDGPLDAKGKANSKTLYQCRFNDSFTADLGKTPWLPVEKMIGTYSLAPKPTAASTSFTPAASFSVVIPFPQFDPTRREELRQKGGLGNAGTVQCYRKTGSATKPVPFLAKAEVDDDAECLQIQPDQTILTAVGGKCSFQVNSFDFMGHTGPILLEPVRAQ